MFLFFKTLYKLKSCQIYILCTTQNDEILGKSDPANGINTTNLSDTFASRKKRDLAKRLPQ